MVHSSGMLKVRLERTVPVVQKVGRAVQVVKAVLGRKKASFRYL
jgi:hypothetical protein